MPEAPARRDRVMKYSENYNEAIVKFIRLNCFIQKLELDCGVFHK